MLPCCHVAVLPCGPAALPPRRLACASCLSKLCTCCARRSSALAITECTRRTANADGYSKRASQLRSGPFRVLPSQVPKSLRLSPRNLLHIYQE